MFSWTWFRVMIQRIPVSAVPLFRNQLTKLKFTSTELCLSKPHISEKCLHFSICCSCCEDFFDGWQMAVRLLFVPWCAQCTYVQSCMHDVALPFNIWAWPTKYLGRWIDTRPVCFSSALLSLSLSRSFQAFLPLQCTVAVSSLEGEEWVVWHAETKASIVASVQSGAYSLSHHASSL